MLQRAAQSLRGGLAPSQTYTPLSIRVESRASPTEQQHDCIKHGERANPSALSALFDSNLNLPICKVDRV